MITGGIAMTISTYSLAAPVGGALVGAGFNSVYHGIQKIAKKERIQFTLYFADVITDAVSGAVCGSISMGGEAIAANIAKQGMMIGAKKLAVRSGVGLINGIVSKVIDEGKQCATTDKKWSDFGKSFDQNGHENGTAMSWITSAVGGSLGGIGSHVTSNTSKMISNGLVKAATRVAVDTTAAAGSDLISQMGNIAVGNQDTYDIGETFTNAIATSVAGATHEGVKNAIYKSYGGKTNMRHDKINKKMIEEVVPKDDQKSTIDGYKRLKKESPSKLETEQTKAQEYTEWKKRENTHQLTMEKYDTDIQEAIASRQEAIKSEDKGRMKETTENFKRLVAEKEVANESKQNVQKYKKEDLAKMTESNAHFLIDENVGQIAVDVNPTNESRGAKRAIFDYKDQSFKFAGYTDKHDYKATPKFGDSDFYQHYESHGNNLKVMNGQICVLACNRTSGSDDDVDQED